MSPVAMPCCSARRGCDLAQRLGVLLDERPDASRLRAREVLAHHSSGGQPHRVLLVDHLGRRAVADRVEPAAPVVGVEPAAFEEPRGAGMVLGRAGPEHAQLALDAFPRDPVVVGAATLGRDAQLLEDLLGGGVREVPALAEPGGDVAEDVPVEPRIAWRLLRRVELDHAALDARRRAFVLLVQRPGQDEVGVERGLGQEEVDDGVELELVQRFAS